VRAFALTREREDTELMFCLDRDDGFVGDYMRILTDEGLDDYGWLGVQTDARRRLAGTLNFYAPLYARTRDVIGFMGDDHLPRTRGWDVLLGEALEAGADVAYGNDLLQGVNLPTAVVMRSWIIRELGYMVPPGLTHLFLDNFWLDLGRALGSIEYVEAAVIEHLHPIAQKAEWDSGYVEVNSAALYAEDEAAYRAYVDRNLAADVSRLVAVRSGV
jgi:hypothetical protein